MTKKPGWHEKYRQMQAADDRDGAFRVLIAAGKRGSLEAAATYARALWAQSDDANAHCVRILEEVERRVAAADGATHQALHLAYSIGVGAGLLEWAEIQRRAFDHLKIAAEASGDANMFLSVGLHYGHGFNGVAKDRVRAQAWLEAAASSGDAECVAAYARFRSTAV